MVYILDKTLLFCRHSTLRETYYIQAARALMIQQRAAPALSFSMVSLKSLQTFTSASGSTVAGIQGLDTVLQEGTWLWYRNPQTCADESRWEGPLETVLSYSSITTPFHPHMHFCLWAGVYPQMSAVALQSISVPDTWGVETIWQENAWGKHCSLTPVPGIFCAEHSVWFGWNGYRLCSRKPQCSRENT